MLVVVLLVVLLSVGSKSLSLIGSLLSLIISSYLEVFQELGVSCKLLLYVLWDNSIIKESSVNHMIDHHGFQRWFIDNTSALLLLLNINFLTLKLRSLF